MGFLGKLFGGHGKRSSTSAGKQPQPPVRNNSSSDSAADPQPEPQSAFVGEHFEGLGDVWTAFFPGGSKKYVESVQELLNDSKPEGPVMRRKDDTGVILFTTPRSGGMCIHSHILMNQKTKEAEFVGGYPSLEGLPVDTVIEQAHIWSNGLSGVVAARTLDMRMPLAFYLSAFFQHVPQIQFGSQMQFHLSGLAFTLVKQTQTEYPVEKGTPPYEILLKGFLAANPDKSEADFEPPTVSTHGRGVIIPTQVVGVYNYQMPVLEVQKVEFLGNGYRRLRTLFAGFGDHCLEGWLYVGEHVLNGYEPEVGDDITGTVWLQGSMEGYPHYE